MDIVSTLGRERGNENLLFGQALKVVNVGLDSFRQSLVDQGVGVVGVNWQPPLSGYIPLNETADGLSIDAINGRAVGKLKASRPMLVGLAVARDIVPKFSGKMLLHAGAPVAWRSMCGPMKGAIVGAILYERWAITEADALQLAASGDVRFEPCHHHDAVGPMAGVVSPSMPVFIVKNEPFGTLAFASVNEGLGKVLRYGAYSAEVIERLRWIEKILYGALARTIEKLGPIDLRTIISQALHMGDEVHNRNRAATSLFIRSVAPALIEHCAKSEAISVLKFLDSNDHFFLNLSMAACKATLASIENTPGCTLVTAMARNGVEFGIRVAAFGERWFTAPAPRVNGLWFPGFSENDANPDLGDSAITETLGLGGASMAAAPAIVRFIGGDVALSTQLTKEMAAISVSEHEAITIPSLDFRGSPLGIDLRKVMETAILPVINTGVAHREPGIGMIGAGIVRAPKECFESAFAYGASMFRTGT